jgi:hypothetical protein
MSANLDLVRSIFADWERGEFGRADWADPQIEFVIVGGPTEGSWHGVAEIARAMREFLGAWKGYRVEAEEYRELDDDRVLVLTHDMAQGRTSGVDTLQMRAYGLHLQGDKVTRLAIYWDRDRALADLGLEE